MHYPRLFSPLPTLGSRRIQPLWRGNVLTTFFLFLWYTWYSDLLFTDQQSGYTRVVYLLFSEKEAKPVQLSHRTSSHSFYGSLLIPHSELLPLKRTELSNSTTAALAQCEVDGPGGLFLGRSSLQVSSP